MPELILIVDDEPALLESVAYSLRQQGYEVNTALTGNEGLELARSVKPDAIILDIMLPGIDGFEVCRVLRQEMNSPILMLTARDDEIDRVDQTLQHA
jgi:DNA-binding response OmpR family regulator